MQVYINRRAKMGDGVELATDVFTPDGPGPWPASLVRTPYHRVNSEVDAQRFTSRDYAYVVQDVRGKFDSEGEFTPLEQEAEDGYFAIDWLANQRWCSGRIALFGLSYLGIVQLPAAARRHEALICIAPGVAPLDFFRDWIRYDGCFALANMLKWPYDNASLRTRANTSHFVWREVWKAARTSSIEELESRVGLRLSLMRKWLAHDTYDDFWRSLDQRRLLQSVRTHGFHFGGYFDHLSRGQFAAFDGLTQNAADNGGFAQHLVVGPWGHTSQAADRYGDWEFGPDSSVDYTDRALSHFDLWIKNRDDGISRAAPVRYFVLGENSWEEAESWPPPEAEPTSWYLGSDRRLSLEGPYGEGADPYLYDPADPTPTHGGQVYWGLSEMVSVGPVDQRDIIARSDTLFFRSDPLSKPIFVAGNIEAELWIASTAEDTDFVTKFCVVDPSGRVDVLTFGSLRCRYRDSASEPLPLPVKEAVRISVQMNHFAYRFPVGSSIGLIVASACFPRILPHPNRFEPTAFGVAGVVAENSILRSNEHPSRLILPVMDH